MYKCPIFDGRIKERGSLFSVSAGDRSRGNEHKLKYKKFHLNIEKTCFSVSVIRH